MGMKLTIYGQASCAACKTLLSVANNSGLNPEYVDIRDNQESYDRFRKVADDNYGEGSRVMLPLVTLESEGIEAVSQGMPDCIAVLKTAKEVA